MTDNESKDSDSHILPAEFCCSATSRKRHGHLLFKQKRSRPDAHPAARANSPPPHKEENSINKYCIPSKLKATTKVLLLAVNPHKKHF